MPMSLDPIPGENEFECARCGALVYYELTRCPQCGVNLYEPEDEPDLPPGPGSADRDHPAGWLAGLGAFFRRLLGRSHPADRLFEAAREQAVLYNDLLLKVGGDREAAGRLIEFERLRLPAGTRAQWLRNALQRWERDN